MKIIASLLLALFSSTASAQVIKQNGSQAAAVVTGAVTVSGLSVGGVVFSSTPANGRLAVDASNLFWDDTNDRLGIGTNSPATKLHVSSGSLTVDGTGAGMAMNSATGANISGVFTSPSGNSAFSQYTNGIANLYVGTTRNTGGGVLAASEPNSGIIGTGEAYPLMLYTNNVNRMTIASDGTVGIGASATRSSFTATGFWEPYSRTRAQIDALVPTKVGQVIYASDTTLPGLCVSTGTSAAQWRKMESATLGCGTGN